MSYDGLVSRHINRRLSRPISSSLQNTAITPNSVTTFTLLLAVAAAAMVAAGWNIAGGVSIQLVSIIDGVDGELARLKNMTTRFGAAFDTVVDRYADALMLGGMGIYATRFEELPRPEVIAALALGGALTVSYSRARIEASFSSRVSGDGFFGLASRDVRLLVATAGTVAGQCYWTLAVLAVISWATVAWRLVALRRIGHSGGGFRRKLR